MNLALIDPIKQLERFIKFYQRDGAYTPEELKCKAFELMPVDKAEEVVSRLPKEVLALLREYVEDASQWSDEDWGSTISINGPQPTAESRDLARRKVKALMACFSPEPDHQFGT